jgi:hypothetical protein
VLLTAGCLDQPRCYLPSNKMIEEGGYEVTGFRRPFGFSATFRRGLPSAAIKDLCANAP